MRLLAVRPVREPLHKQFNLAFLNGVGIGIGIGIDAFTRVFLLGPSRPDIDTDSDPDSGCEPPCADGP